MSVILLRKALRRRTPSAFATTLIVTALITVTQWDLSHAQTTGGPLPQITVEPKPTKSAPKKAAPKVAPTATAAPLAVPDGIVVDGPLPTTTTTAGPVVGYRALTSVSATRTDTPVERIPQSIQIVPRSLISDTGALSVTEAVRNISNVQAPHDLMIGNTDLQPIKIRGFGAEQWLDGLVVVYDAGWRDALANVERIEVLKGPNAILYGGGPGAPVGGAINVISKLPTDKASGETGVTFGSHKYFRPYFDINQPLTESGTVLFRITGEYLSADSFVDVVESNNYSINPTITFTNRTDTSLTVQLRKSKSEQQGYPGLPVTGTLVGDFRIPREAFMGPPTIPPSYSEVQGITLSFDHKFSSNLSTNIKARWSESEFNQLSQLLINGDFTGATPLFPPSFWGLANTRLFQQQREFTINPTLTAKFALGESRNTLLVGADYSRVTDKGFMYSDFLPGLVDLSNPSFPFPYADPTPASLGFVPFFDFDNTYTTKGLYAQLQSSWFNRVHFMGGLRLASVEIDYFERTLLSNFTTEETRILPKAGVVVDVLPGLSVYASYSEGLRGVPFSTAALELKPEHTTQQELGVKFNISNQFTGTLAYFDIERSNIPVGLGLGIAALSEQHSHGFEADLLWQASRNWQILANYAFTQAEYADAFQGVPKGNLLVAVPEHSGRLWVNYTFDPDVLKGWSIGSGIYLASEQFVDAANLYKTDGFFTVDAKVAYTTGPFSAALHIKNLTDEKYFVPYTWLGGQVAPGEGRVFYGVLSYKY